MNRTNRLKCPICSDYRFLVLVTVRFEGNNRSVDYNVPFFECKVCRTREELSPREEWEERAEEDRRVLEDGQSKMTIFNYENRSFEQYEHLGFEYDSVDYYLIPGLSRTEDEGYLTPVFFNKDVLLYYNNHPDYSVRLHSFSSGNIYQGDSRMLGHGFGINRNGKIFMWLGDLDEDFAESEMQPHLKRFQASNVKSDHDIYSKYYLTQVPYSIEDAFQRSDNEYQLFDLKSKFENLLKNFHGLTLSKLDISELSEYYSHPVLEHRPQIFTSYSSLNKYLVENIQQDELKQTLRNAGVSKEELKGLRSLKLLEQFFKTVLEREDSKELAAPLYVLNDLRQLADHLSIDGFEERYNSCKNRLSVKPIASDFEVYHALVRNLIGMYDKLNNSITE